MNDSLSEQVISLRPLVMKIARAIRARNPVARYDDLYSDGLYGAWEAVRNFDPSHKASLFTHAASRIRGAMLDGLRDRDPLTRKQRAEGEINVCNLYPDYDAPSNVDHTAAVLARIAFDEIAELVPAADRELIVAHYRDGITKGRLAESCGYSHGWMTSTMTEIIDRLRVRLEARVA